MSELINNRAYRQKVLKELITELHDGQPVEAVKARFAEAFQNVSAEEISEAEQALMREGLPVSEIQRLCDVHAAVFKGSIEEIHRTSAEHERPNHPLQVFRQENRAFAQLIDQELLPHLRQWMKNRDQAAANWQLQQDLALLAEIDRHYLKKENVFFPLLEQYGITAPPKVMWGVDDEIRDAVRLSLDLFKRKADHAVITDQIQEAARRVHEMIYKEENILAPMLVEHLTPAEWQRVSDDFSEIGYCLIEDPEPWTPQIRPAEPAAAAPAAALPPTADGSIVLPSGALTTLELTRLLDTLPFDLTFVDRNDRVKYFSQTADRIFPRSKSIIGREVANCHPPKSVHVVQKIVDDFRSGRKDHEDFWIQMGPRLVLIRYYAVRTDAGEYLGTAEVTQDIGPIQKITGEKRLMGL